MVKGGLSCIQGGCINLISHASHIKGGQEDRSRTAKDALAVRLETPKGACLCHTRVSVSASGWVPVGALLSCYAMSGTLKALAFLRRPS